MPVVPGNQYNVPRAPEVYTLVDSIDAAIPADVKSRFQRDNNGRVLFFTAPPLERPHKGISEQHARLGHSVSHLANIDKVREERRRKRKERDEAKGASAELEMAASRKLATLKTAPRGAGEDVAVRWLRDLSEYMLAGNEMLEQRMAGWRETREQVRREKAGKSAQERRADDLRHLFDMMVQDGVMKPEERNRYEEVFVQHKLVKEAEERDPTDFLVGSRHAWEKKFGNVHVTGEKGAVGAGA